MKDIKGHIVPSTPNTVTEYIDRVQDRGFHGGHFVEVCECGAVLSSCKCPSHDKKRIISKLLKCAKCKALQEIGHVGDIEAVAQASTADNVLDLTPEQPNNTFEDAKVFGPDMYVYCASHVNPHLTGWCTVGIDNKLGLGIPRGDDIDAARTEALAKCRRLNLPLYSDKV